MITTTREHLLGYLLGALEADEQAQVERELETDPRLRHELEILRRRTAPLAWREEDEAPAPRLAERTCSRIFALDALHIRRAAAPAADQHSPLARREAAADNKPAKPARAAADELHGGGVQGWSTADLVVLGGVCLAMLIMLAPMLHSNRELARRAFCQNNLRRLGDSLEAFAELSSNGAFPFIAPAGRTAFSGTVAAKLYDHQLLTRPETLVCPSDDLEIQVYSMADLNTATDAELAEARWNMLGSMGYNLGVLVDGEYQAVRNQGRSHYALMSEIPRENSETAGNHGHGRNVLFEDKHVEYRMPDWTTGDDPFHNRHGLIAAGIGVNDAVIGPGHASPLGSAAVRPVSWTD